MKEKKVDRFTAKADQVGKAKISGAGKKAQSSLNNILKGSSGNKKGGVKK